MKVVFLGNTIISHMNNCTYTEVRKCSGGNHEWILLSKLPKNPKEGEVYNIWKEKNLRKNMVMLIMKMM
jgi:hypothetical protein